MCILRVRSPAAEFEAAAMLDRDRPPPATRTKAQARRERDRRYRQRVRSGLIVVPVELDGRALNWLLSVNCVMPVEADQGDARAIGAAVTAGIAASARG
jgi:hypothetical protein